MQVQNWWDADQVHLAIGVCAAAVALFLAVVSWWLYSRFGCSFCCGCSRCPACCKARSRTAINERRRKEERARYLGAVNPQQMPFEDYGLPMQSMYSHSAAAAVNATTTNPHYVQHFPTYAQAGVPPIAILEDTFDEDFDGNGGTSNGKPGGSALEAALETAGHTLAAKVQALSAGDGGGTSTRPPVRSVTFDDTVAAGVGTGVAGDLNTTADVIADLKAAADQFEQSELVWKGGGAGRQESFYDDFNPVDNDGGSSADGNPGIMASFGGGGGQGSAAGPSLASLLTPSSQPTAAAPSPSSRTVIVESGGAGVGIAVDACAKIVPGSSGVCIVAIAKGSAAAATGQLKVGDVITSVNNTDMTGASVAETVKEITDTNSANGCFVLGIATVAAVAEAMRATPSTRDRATIRTYDAWNASFTGGDAGIANAADDAHAGRQLLSAPPQSPLPPPPPGPAPVLSDHAAALVPAPPPMPTGPRPADAPPEHAGTALKQRLQDRRNDQPSTLNVAQSIKQKLQQRREDAESAAAGAAGGADTAAANSTSSAASHNQAERGSRVATARYAFEATEPSHLTLEEGEVLTLLEDRDLWVLAENIRGEQGDVPANYVVERGVAGTPPTPPPIGHREDDEEQSWA